MIRNIFVNTGSNVFLLAIKLVITFIMTPILVRNMGAYDYGLWEMLMAVIGYMGLLDLGIKPAISRFSAKYRAENDNVSLDIIFSSTFVFLGLVGFLLFIILIVWALFFSYTLTPENGNLETYTFLLIIIAAQLLLSFPGFVAESYLEGFQKYYLKNNITIFNTLLGNLIVFIYISPSNALLLLAGANAVGTMVKYVCFYFILSSKKFGGICFRFKNYSWTRLKEIIKFGLKSFIQGVASRIEIGTDTVVIGWFLGPAAVPLYSIPANLVGHIRNLGYTLTHAFMPLFSSLNALNQKEKINKVYLMASKFVVGLILPISIGAVIVGKPFLDIWIGSDFTKNADTIIFLLVFFSCIPFLNPFSSRYLTAIGAHGIFAKLMPISAIINLISSIILVQYYGVIGVAIGSAIPVLFFFPIFLRFTCLKLGISVTQYIKSSIAPLIIPAILMSVIVLLFRINFGMDSYFLILSAVFLGASVYGILFVMLSLTFQERSMFIQKIRNFSKKS